MPRDLTPGAEACLGMRRTAPELSRKSASTGQLQRAAIPGYTGFVPGRYCENVISATIAEAAKLSETAVSRRSVARGDADSERLRQWRGFDVMAGTIDRGNMNATIGTSNEDGLTQHSVHHE